MWPLQQQQREKERKKDSARSERHKKQVKEARREGFSDHTLCRSPAPLSLFRLLSFYLCCCGGCCLPKRQPRQSLGPDSAVQCRSSVLFYEHSFPVPFLHFPLLLLACLPVCASDCIRLTRNELYAHKHRRAHTHTTTHTTKQSQLSLPACDFIAAIASCFA